MILFTKLFIFLYSGINFVRTKLGFKSVEYPKWVYKQVSKEVIGKYPCPDEFKTKDITEQRAFLNDIKKTWKKNTGVCGELSHMEDEKFHGFVLSFNDVKLGFSKNGRLTGLGVNGKELVRSTCFAINHHERRWSQHQHQQ